MENIYYKKKKNKKGFVFGLVFTVILVVGFYLLNYFNINPPYMMKLVNDGDMPTDAYNRDFIFSIYSDVENNQIPPMEIVLNESTNSGMSETLQEISLLVGGESFAWRKFYKFNTLIKKTPYDVRYIKFDNYIDNGYAHTYRKEKSLLLNEILKSLIKDSNPFVSFEKFDTKKIKINAYEEKLADKFKFMYEINFDANEAATIFENIYDSVWNNEEFISFFVSDNLIQEKINVKNNTKHVLDILDNIKNNIDVNGLNTTIILNKDYPESISLNFDVTYTVNSTKTTINIGLSEYLKALSSDYSPESNLDIISVTSIDELGGVKNE